jgi:hypothetical protein
VRNAALADWREGISVENVDEGRRCASTSLLDQRVSYVGVAGCAQLGCPRRIGGSAQDVADLRGVRQWVQVGGGCGVASGPCSMLPCLVRRALRRSVGIQRSDALQLRAAPLANSQAASIAVRGRGSSELASSNKDKS